MTDDALADVPYLQALTLTQPMASALVVPHPRRKDVENRPRPLPRDRIGRPTVVAVHAGLAWGEAYARTCLRILGTGVDWDRAANLGGHLLGLALLSGRQLSTSSPPADPALVPWWDPTLFGYEVPEAEALPRPVRCRGNRGWWPVPPAATRLVLDQLPRWRALITSSNPLRGVLDDA